MVAKGVQRADDAVRCVEAGAAAIVVSNHRARQLADVPATADLLSEIVEAVAGRVEVYVDGGVRQPPMSSRRWPWALVPCWSGARGCGRWPPAVRTEWRALLGWYESELRRAMALCGAASVDAIERSLVRRAAGWDLSEPLA